MGLAKAVLIVQLSLFLLTSLTVFAQILPEALPPHYHAISPVMPPAHPPTHHHHHPHPPTPSPTKPPTYAPPTKAPMPPAHPPSHHHHPHPPTPSPTKPPTYTPPSKAPMPPAHPPSHHHHHPHPPTPSPTKPPTYAPPPKPPTKPPTYAPPPKPVQPPAKPPTKPPTYSPPPKTPTKPPTYAPPTKTPVKPPTYPPPPPATAKPPAYPKPTRSLVAVQGVVFCKSCKYNGSDTLLGATPILGATVKITCKNTKYKQEATGKTDKNGYFFLQAPKTVTSFGAHKCTVSLVSSPLKTCTKPSNLHGGLKGAILRPEKPFTANKLPFMLYTVGPLAFEPKCY